MNKSPLDIEKAIDLLFNGSEVHGSIARLLCDTDALSSKIIEDLKEHTKTKYPKEFKDMKPRFIDAIKSIFNKLSEHFDKETSSRILTVEKEAAANGVEAYFIGDFPREMVRSGSISKVRDIEVFCPNGGITSSEGILVHSSVPPDSIVPYLKLLDIKDTPFNRFAVSRGLAADAVGILVGTNEVLDPTRIGVSDILDGKVSTILPADYVYENMPSTIFRAIRMAGRNNMILDGRLKVCISSKVYIGLPKERILVEMATISKQAGCNKILEDLGLEA